MAQQRVLTGEEARKYMEANPNEDYKVYQNGELVKENKYSRGVIGDVLYGMVSPFVNIARGGAELGTMLGAAAEGIAYDPMKESRILTVDELNNPLEFAAKNTLGAMAFATPGAKQLQGLLQSARVAPWLAAPVAQGFVGSALGSLGAQDVGTGFDVGQALGAGVAGGALGGVIGTALRVPTWMQNRTLTNQPVVQGLVKPQGGFTNVSTLQALAPEEQLGAIANLNTTVDDQLNALGRLYQTTDDVALKTQIGQQFDDLLKVRPTPAAGATVEPTGIIGKTKAGLVDKFKQSELNALRRAVGGKPSPKLGGDKLVKELDELVKEMSEQTQSKIILNGADDVINFSDDMYKAYGAKVATDAANLSQKGVTLDTDKTIKQLQKLLDKAMLDSDKAAIQRALDDIIPPLQKSGGDLTVLYNLKQEIGPKGKWNQFYDPNTAKMADTYEKAYNLINKGLKDVFAKNGIKDFAKTNKILSIAMRAKQWADPKVVSAGTPGAFTLPDPVQDVILGGILTGNPAIGLGGAALKKYAQSPTGTRQISQVAQRLLGGTQPAQNLAISGINQIGKTPFTLGSEFTRNAAQFNAINNTVMPWWGQLSAANAMRPETGMTEYPQAAQAEVPQESMNAFNDPFMQGGDFGYDPQWLMQTVGEFEDPALMQFLLGNY